jgi:hypothetical protein
MSVTDARGHGESSENETRLAIVENQNREDKDRGRGRGNGCGMIGVRWGKKSEVDDSGENQSNLGDCDNQSMWTALRDFLWRWCVGRRRWVYYRVSDVVSENKERDVSRSGEVPLISSLALGYDNMAKQLAVNVLPVGIVAECQRFSTRTLS